MADYDEPDEVEVNLGRKLKLRRKMADMTQKELASRLGVTFQQIQKYEKGTNRISAARMNEITKILNIGFDYFFADDDSGHAYQQNKSTYGTGFAEAPTSAPSANRDSQNVLDFLETNDGLKLNIAFSRIEDKALRKKIIALAEKAANDADEEKPDQAG